MVWVAPLYNMSISPDISRRYLPNILRPWVLVRPVQTELP